MSPAIQVVDFASFIITRSQWNAVERNPGPAFGKGKELILRARNGTQHIEPANAIDNAGRARAGGLSGVAFCRQVRKRSSATTS